MKVVPLTKLQDWIKSWDFCAEKGLRSQNLLAFLLSFPTIQSTFFLLFKFSSLRQDTTRRDRKSAATKLKRVGWETDRLCFNPRWDFQLPAADAWKSSTWVVLKGTATLLSLSFLFKCFQSTENSQLFFLRAIRHLLPAHIASDPSEVSSGLPGCETVWSSNERPLIFWGI